MKKIIIVIALVVSVMSLSIFAVGCGEQKGEDVVINVAVPDGAPALAIASMLAGKTFDGYQVNYEIVDGTDIATKLTAKQADIAIMPTNLAAKLYNNGLGIKTVATNVYGLLYLVGTEDIVNLTSLKDQKILCTGQGGTPDFVLQYILSVNGIENVDIQYISKGSDAIAALKQGTAKFALLGEPAATMAVSKANAKVLLDMQAEWEKCTGNYGYPQACTVVTDEIFANHAEFLKIFLKEMKQNIEWMPENVEAINTAIKDHGGATSFANADVIARCNIKYVSSLSAVEEIEEYLEIMSTFNPKFIGGKLPAKGFYAGVNID